MASARSVIIAGAGIGGLTAALAIARRGLHVTVLDQVPRLEEIGAGVQLSPNVSRVLLSLGLGEELQPHVVVPEQLRVMDAQTARVLARAPLGAVPGPSRRSVGVRGESVRGRTCLRIQHPFRVATSTHLGHRQAETRGASSRGGAGDRPGRPICDLEELRSWSSWRPRCPSGPGAPPNEP